MAQYRWRREEVVVARMFDLGGDGTEVASDRVLTVPNLLSFARLLVLPWLYVEVANGRLVRGFVIAVVFGSTDWLDGYLARRLDQVTKLGQLLDPVSDRLFIGVLVVALAVSGLLPWWVVAVIVARDVVMLLAGLVLLGRGVPPPAVTRLGKLATWVLGWAFVPLFLSGIVGTVDDPNQPLYLLGLAGLGVGTILYYATSVDYARTLLAADATKKE